MRGKEGLLLSIRCFPDMYGSPIVADPDALELIYAHTKANIVRRDPREERTINMERVKTIDLAYPNKATRSLLERSMTMKVLLKVIGVFGVSLVMSG